MAAQQTPTSPESPETPEAAAVTKAANGATLTGEEERSALDFLLGATTALEYDVPVDFDTPKGMKKLVFHIRQMDPDKIDEIDSQHRTGEGPFAKLDVTRFNADLVSHATVYIREESGRKVDPKSEEFRGGLPSPALAMGLRFKFQGGLLESVAEQIRQVSGFGADRVGKAQRVLVEAGKDSSNGAG